MCFINLSFGKIFTNLIIKNRENFYMLFPWFAMFVLTRNDLHSRFCANKKINILKVVKINHK